MHKPLLIIISGPSGAGKTSIAQQLITELEPLFPIKRIVTCTTRTPRPQEQDGIDYTFITKPHFEELKKENFFFENTVYNNEFYGTPNTFKELLKQNITCIEVTDYTVATHIKQSIPNSLLFWIKPPNIKTLKNRLLQRKTDSIGKIEKRITIAEEELAREEKNHFFDYHIINDTFDHAVQKIKVIILEKNGYTMKNNI